MCNTPLCWNKERCLPLSLREVLAPLLRRRLQAVRSWPEYSISSVIAIQRSHVWRGFQIRMIRAQIPFIRVYAAAPVSPRKTSPHASQ